MIIHALLFALAMTLIGVGAYLTAIGFMTAEDGDEQAASVLAKGPLILAAAIGLILILIQSTPARAQEPSPCVPWELLVRSFERQHGEVPIGGGQVSDHLAVQVLASPSGQFTIVVVNRHGFACPLAVGRDWDPGRLPAAPPIERDS